LTVQPESTAENGTARLEVNRREYSRLVANDIIEDYALRYSPAEFRNWSEFLVSNTAIGSISFLALEAIGASIAIAYGFQNAFWGILTASIIIFILGVPICYQAAKHNIDIDLLTRAAGFGYLGSTITSLIYASFCFIFFALEAAIMAQALYLYFGLPLPAGYIFCSFIIFPIVYYGMTAISRLQLITQPIWLILMILPFVLVLIKAPNILDSFTNFSGSKTGNSQFSWHYFGLSLGISLSLIAQIGEQVDYLRFMPNKTKDNRIKWWMAVLLAGPGWAILGFLKQIGGILLAALVLLGGASLIEAREPIHMYNAAYHYVFENPEVALLVSFIFVMVSQIKINVTNAYAGSLAWSNFFSRTTHTHPGRVIWVIFNITIALLLMLMGVFDVLEKILGLYSNIAIAWVAAIFADLVINKPLGLSPPVIEFKRAHLFNINPVGLISTLVASTVSIISFSGILGLELQAFSSILALSIALILSPLIAYLTKGKYYIARKADVFEEGQHTCGVCHTEYSAPDMATCPMYSSNICSLCCSIEARCHDMCKIEEEFSIKEKAVYLVGKISKGRIQPEKISRYSGFLIIFTGLLLVASFLLWTSYIVRITDTDPILLESIKGTYANIFYLLALISFVGSWIIVLMQESRAYVESELTVKNSELTAQTERVKLLQKSASDANKSTKFNEAVHDCLDTVCNYTGWPMGHAYVLSEGDDNELVSSEISYMGDSKRFSAFIETSRQTTFRRGVGLPGRVLADGKPAWIVEVTKDANFPRAKLADDIGVHSAFAFPVFVNDRVVAVLEFFGENVDEPDDPLLDTVAHIGGQLGRVFAREEAENEIRIARDAAEDATKAKANFLAAMSHEIRTPMNGVVGMIDLLRESTLDDDQIQMVDTVKGSAYSLLTIINDILDFSKIEAGKLDLEEIPISICDAVEGVGEALAVTARNKNIQLCVYVDPNIPEGVIGDQVRLRQIIFNLGGNAIKFTEQGKVLIRADRIPSNDDTRATIRLQVIDDGIGIPEKAQKSLFQAFSQVDASTTRRFGGTGLGLSICQRLTELMNGEIGVHSVEGEGSTFHVTITFPIAEEHNFKRAGEDLDGLRVLLALRDPELRDLIPRYLQHSKARTDVVEEMTDIKESALAAIAESDPFDVIVLGSVWDLKDQIALIEKLGAEKELSAKFIVACRQRSRKERKELGNTVYVDADPLQRTALVRGVAVATGRASPDVEYDDVDIMKDPGKAPTVEEADAMGQLILLAEDNLTNQNVIKRQLTVLGYAVEIADDGIEALKLMGKRSYAILLTDCHMPNMDGFLLTKAIRKGEANSSAHLPIVAITASVMKEEIDNCFGSGMDDYLPKPLEMDKLRAMLRKWMPASESIAVDENNNSISGEIITPSASEEKSDNGNSAIDPSALKSVFGDDEETFIEILKEFIEPSTSNVADIDSAFSERSAEGVAMSAHKLKSSARSIGANDLADLCQTLESAGKIDDWDVIDEETPRLSSTFQRVVEYIDAL
jgi:signal transduction histidine kinase/CheY-like chemotaxis protein/purine-cytosine permease-like protein/HPt (histidine-containing phosphotransfer) domain-containing protein